MKKARTTDSTVNPARSIPVIRLVLLICFLLAVLTAAVNFREITSAINRTLFDLRRSIIRQQMHASMQYRIGQQSPFLVAATPWQCVGGCGAGGSGGTTANIKWIGTGSGGGLISGEFMGSNTLAENYRYMQLKSRFSLKPTYTSDLGITLPVVSKIGSLQPSALYEDKTEVSGGMTDMTVDFSKSVGLEGEYGLQFALTLPTGQYDIKRGKEQNMLYLPTSLQRGSGLFQASFGLTRSLDVDRGIWIMEAYYNHPFAVNFKGKNSFINGKPDQYNELNNKWDLLSANQKKRFEYYFKPYGENDLGGYTPPSIAANLYYGYRGIPHYVHSFGVKTVVPLGVAWIPDFSASSYNPVPDPDFKAWTMTLHYGLEFSRPEYPLFLSINKLISSRPSALKTEQSLSEWNAPGVSELLNTWTFALGIRTSWF